MRRSKEKAPAAATAQGIQQKSQWSDCPMLATRNTWQRIRSLYKAMHLAAAAGDVSAYKQAYAEWRALLPEVRDDLDRIDDSRLRVAELSAFGLYPVPAGSARAASPVRVNPGMAESFTDADAPATAARGTGT